MRVSRLSPGFPLVALLLAVLVHTALGPILACHADVPGRSVALAAVVEPAPCPGCVPKPLADGERAGSTTFPTSPIGWNPCSSDRPCQHGPSGGGPRAMALPDGLRDPGPAAPALRLSPDPQQRQTAPGADPVPARPASVAVLCVDRS